MQIRIAEDKMKLVIISSNSCLYDNLSDSKAANRLPSTDTFGYVIKREIDPVSDVPMTLCATILGIYWIVSSRFKVIL